MLPFGAALPLHPDVEMAIRFGRDFPEDAPSWMAQPRPSPDFRDAPAEM